MGQNIVVLKGSPRRKGNSAILADQAILGARAAGAVVDEFYLHGMKIKPCAACDGCRKGDWECVTKDDMQKIYPKLVLADAIILASPIYFFTFSAQLKLCLDRWYGLRKPDPVGYLLKGKKFGVLLSFGGDDVYDSGAINAIHTFESIFGYIGSRIDALVYGSANAEGEIAEQKEIMDKAYALGRQLAQAG